MKILFVPGQYPFCYYYRGYLPGVYAKQIVISDFFWKERVFSGEELIEKADRADVIVFQRPTSKNTVQLAKLLKKKGKKVIFENDDTYSGVPLHRLGNEKRVEIAKELNNNLNEFLPIADGVIASTEVLAKEYAALNSNVIVLKNCIDPLDEFPCTKNETGKFRVGLIGSVSSNDDYVHIKDQLKRLDERGDITFVILGVKFQDGTIMPSMQEDYDFWSSLKNVEWHPVVHVTEYMATVASFALDLAIIPRKEHYFNQCKSNLKFLEMSLLHIPVIAQGFGDGTSPYQGLDEPYMTVITDNDQWYKTVVEAKEQYGKYKELAEKAHDYVLENYNIKNYAQEWVNQIEKLCKFQKSI